MKKNIILPHSYAGLFSISKGKWQNQFQPHWRWKPRQGLCPMVSSSEKYWRKKIKISIISVYCILFCKFSATHQYNIKWGENYAKRKYKNRNKSLTLVNYQNKKTWYYYCLLNLYCVLVLYVNTAIYASSSPITCKD